MKGFEKRFKYVMSLSPRQKDILSMLYVVLFEGKYGSLSSKDIPNLNPKWWEQKIKHHSFRTLGSWQVENLEKNKETDYGHFKVRKTRKGFVIEIATQFRFKKIEKIRLVCSRCNKEKLLDIFGICKKCGTELKKKRKYTKFLFGWREGI